MLLQLFIIYPFLYPFYITFWVNELVYIVDCSVIYLFYYIIIIFLLIYSFEYINFFISIIKINYIMIKYFIKSNFCVTIYDNKKIKKEKKIKKKNF